jgi:hypothetical protein
MHGFELQTDGGEASIATTTPLMKSKAEGRPTYSGRAIEKTVTVSGIATHSPAPAMSSQAAVERQAASSTREAARKIKLEV